MNEVSNDLINPHLDYSFYLLDKLLASMGKSLQDYQLPQYNHNWRDSSANPLLAE